MSQKFPRRSTDFSALGLWNVSQSYFEAADFLTKAEIERRLSLAFDSPIRSMFAHTWELSLKACLVRQGVSHAELKKGFGHDLSKAFAAIDRDRFQIFRLTDPVGVWLESLSKFHRARRYAYPQRGLHQENTLTYLREATQRFSISRHEALALFGGP